MDLIETFVPALQEQAKPCPVFKEGQQFVIDLYPPTQPDGFCGWAWYDIQRSLSIAIESGEMNFGISFPTCNDGLRPVVFRLEQIDEEAPDREFAG
jgi:uncharacterized repeat protein (TIGR04076 family)